MLSKRIIPCLDIKDGKVVKGVNFIGLREVGDPVELAKQYEQQNADEVVFLDITASHEARDIIADLISRAARELSIPLTVGGGIRTVDDFRRILAMGADKVAVNSAALSNPAIIAEASAEFGNQCVVSAIDAKARPDGKKRGTASGQTGASGWEVYIKGGRENTGVDLIEWAQQVAALGAGEILLTSMDKDGTRDGFDLPMLAAVCEAVNIPVIASGGCGDIGSITELFEQTDSDAALAASIFHYGEATVDQVKAELAANHIPVRQPRQLVHPVS